MPGQHLRAAAGSREPASVAVAENLSQSAREGLGLTGVSEFAAEEAAVVAREHGRVLTEQLGRGDRCTPGERVERLLAYGDHDPCLRGGQGVDVGAVAADGPGPVGEERGVA